jgi:hypothetical protein
MLKNFNGKIVEFNDTVISDSVTVFGFKDRIKILFGFKFYYRIETYTKEEVDIVHIEERGYVESVRGILRYWFKVYVMRDKGSMCEVYEKEK